MTTQPEAAVGGEAVEAEAPTLEDRLTSALGDVPPEQDEETPVKGEAEEARAAEAETEEAEDETDTEEEADDLPPIDAPVSWDGEAKAKFAELPRDVQEYVAKREGERERFVQQKSQEATRAKQDALGQASAELAQIEAGYAQQYGQAAAILDQLSGDPDYSLLATNPVEFARQAELAKHFRAQRDSAQRNAQQLAQQAQARAEQMERAEHAEQHRVIIETFPEYADPTTGPELQRKLSSVAKELGYPDELIGQARATDILAMRQAAQWRDDALAYRKLMSQKMQKVRAAKDKPPVTARPGAAPAPGAARQQQYATDREAMRRGDRDATTRVLSTLLDPKT